MSSECTTFLNTNNVINHTKTKNTNHDSNYHAQQPNNNQDIAKLEVLNALIAGTIPVADLTHDTLLPLLVPYNWVSN